VIEPDGHVEMVPAPQVSSIDTTGAGDAFQGTLAHFLAAGDELREAVRKGCAVAALTVQVRGTQSSYPDRATAYGSLM